MVSCRPERMEVSRVSVFQGSYEASSSLFRLPGPFQAKDMNGWMDAGYFTMDLMVKRVCDSSMLPLGELSTHTLIVYWYMYM